MNTSNPPIAALQDLLRIMATLRDPEQGCPWDIKQTWQTIVPYTLEEAYEVADAIDRQDPNAVRDELGDLLLQVVFMARIAEEEGLFDFNDVAQGVAEKMRRRHPHVFGDTKYDNEAAQKWDWEAIKQTERQQRYEQGLFAGIPNNLPALRRSQKIQKRAAQVGFDWENWQQVVPKIEEELAEVAEAVAGDESAIRIEEEMGDVLLATANMARMLGLDAENALRLANRKFATRFEQVIELLQQDGVTLEEASLPEMEAAWERAKQQKK